MTKASTFVRSWLGLPNSFYGTLFQDCYISIEPEKLIHIVLKNIEDNTNNDVFTTLKDNNNFLYSKTLEYNTVFTFKIPIDKENDFDNFVIGRYSKLSNSAKELIIMSHEGMKNIKNLAVILYPEKRHRDTLSQKLDFQIKDDAEIYDKPDLTKELLPEIYK
jgi:hypothetical protein